MKRLYIFIFLVGLLGNNIMYAQIPASSQSLPSPNVAALGLYGEIPVSKFTGMPDISVPLYEVPVGDLKLPFSLNYHAAGIRPDQHPGWVGMGWNLNTGGVVSRTVKGKPDDCNVKNHTYLMNMGYYFHSETLNTPQWNTQDYLKATAQSHGGADFEPDEFDFNFLDYHGKFMLNSDKTWIVQCDRPVKVNFSGNWMDVPFEKANTAFQYSGYSPSFDGFTLTTEDGTQYIFGKERNAIEYSIGFFQQATDFWTATAWYLTKIILTNGQEITYTYERGDFINQMFISLYDDLGSFTFSGGILTPECSSSSHVAIEDSYQGSLISPVYLNRISFPECEITFAREVTTELRYSQDIYAFQYMLWRKNPKYRFLNFLADNPLDDNYPNCLDKLKWYKLSNLEIKDKKGKWIRDYHFSYNDNTSQRLMLQSVSEFVWGANGRNFNMEYDFPEQLPPYLSGKVDHWGFYNNRLMTDNYATHYDSREPNANVLTFGVLKRLRYPTGGYTRFVFEPHEYCKQVKMNRWEGYEDTFQPKIAGGLRIKKIINSDTGLESGEKVENEYFYVDDYLVNKEKARISSGFLGGQIKYYFDDYQVEGTGANKDVKRIIRRFSSQSVLPACINSSGNHIGYSEVIEKRPDGSFIRSKYTNFDNGHMDEAPEAIIFPNRTPYGPYASRSVERGKLLCEELYSAGGILQSSKHLTYERSSDLYVRSMKTSLDYICPTSFITYADGCSYKVYLYDYRLKSEKDTLYDNPSFPISTQTDYEYDPDGLIKVISESANGGIRKQTYKRIRESSSDIYTQMVQKHILSPIVEKKEYFISEDGTSCQLKQVKYEYVPIKGVSDHFFPCYSVWERIGEGALKEVYNCIDYDALGHPLYVVRNEGKTVYLWSYNYLHLAAEIKGATISEVRTAMGGDIVSFMQADTPDRVKLVRLRASLPQAQITSYTYQPMAGVTSITDPCGVVSYYEYDLLQRLNRQKDNYGRTIKAYDYRYSVNSF